MHFLRHSILVCHKYSRSNILYLIFVKFKIYTYGLHVCISKNYLTGARRSRDVVFTVLSDACGDGDLTLQEALEAVKDIFRENALRLYKLNSIAGLINSENIFPHNIVPKYFNDSQNGEDVVFVRIIWVDASGQHRCRVSIPSRRNSTFYAYLH